MSEMLDVFQPETPDARVEAARHIHRVRDQISEDHDRALAALRAGGGFQEMRAMVTAAHIFHEVRLGLTAAADAVLGKEEDE